MNWDIERRIDEAFVAYLRPLIPGTMRAYPSCTNEALQFPCVVVHAGEGANVNEDGLFNGHRRINVHVNVMCESADELDANSAVMRSALLRMSDSRGAVMEALAKSALQDDLNAVNSPGVKFSMACVTTTSDVVVEGRLLVADIVVEVIANPTN